MRTRIYIIINIVLGVLLAACSHIADDERLIYVKPAPAVRCVLLEDFTGQRCVNCPRGSEVIKQLQADYGDSVVIAVGIHGGPLGFTGNNKLVGLATDVGNEYYNYWQLEYRPVGLIDRHGAVNYTDWAAAVKEELARPAPLTMKAVGKIANGVADISLTMMGTDGNVSGMLQVWLLEDGITAMQLMPDGTTNSQYVHNHVFRMAVNGTWGEAFTIQEGETKITHHTQALDQTWNLEQLSVVAFVYNDQGVQQATVTRLKINN